MPRRAVPAFGVGLLGLLELVSHALGAAPAASLAKAAPSPLILPLADVRPGMVGHGLTVFQGTQPEAFNIRVIAVLRKFLPRQDVILVRAEDARLERTGIVAGMSGSPVYVDGKLMGALAYAWNFSKEPLAGVTPIEAMLAERRRPRHAEVERVATGPDAGARVMTFAEGGDGGVGGEHAPDGGDTVLGGGAREEGMDGGNVGASDLRPASLALTISGVSSRVLGEFAADSGAVGLRAVQGGGGGGRATAAGAARGRVEPGSAIAVELIRGDMSAVGTGTVTYVAGNDVLAFGHPMMGVGEIYLPLVDAEVHAILPSLSQSLKLSSPLHEVGSLVQDRQACIVGDLGFRTSMIPTVIRVRTPQLVARPFATEVARNRRLTPTLLALVATSAVTDAEPTVTDVMLTIETRLSLRGLPPLVLEDRLFSSDGISKTAILGSRGLRAVSELLFNPFAPVVIERVEMIIDVTHGREVAEIVGVAAPGGRVRPGATLPLRVTMRPFAGPEYSETLSVVVPATAANEALRIEVAAGAQTRRDVAPPESLRGYVENLQAAYSPLSIVATIGRPDDGVALRGRLLPSLPGSAFDTLKPASQSRRAESYRITERRVLPTRQVIVGKQELSVWVGDDANVTGAQQ